MKKILRKNTYIIVGIIFAVVLGLIIFKENTDRNQNTYTITKGTVSDELIFAGVIDAQKRVDLGFAVSGRIAKNYFNEGDYVEEGQVIAELDQNTLKSSLIQASANYTLTRVDTDASINEVKDSYQTTLEQQDSIVEGLRQQYLSGDLQAFIDDKNTSHETVPPIISGNYNSGKEGNYRLEVYGSSAASGFSFRLYGLESGTYTGEVNQTGKLGESGLYIQFDPNTSYNNSDWIVPVPNTRSSSYLARKTAYQNALTNRELILNTAKNNRDRVLAIDTQTNISRTQAQIENARAQVDAVNSRLSDGKIRAPFSGIIIKNDLEVGEMINAFETPIILFENNMKKLVLNTPEIYINKINIGNVVSISLDAYPDILFNGEISSIDTIDTMVDGVPVYQTEVNILSEDNRIRVGMNAHASIVVFEKKDVLVVPQHFIKQKDNVNFVFLISDSSTVEKIIETGLKGNNGLVEVISGVFVGDIITNEDK